jgi:hypothetical protein
MVVMVVELRVVLVQAQTIMWSKKSHDNFAIENER